jgi:sensor histidine kinase YesM
MTEEKIQSILQESEAKGTGNSIGIGNVKRRLELLYGENCLMISSKHGIGTKMIIQIPINPNQQSIKGELNNA